LLQSYITLSHITSLTEKLTVAWRDSPPSACRNFVGSCYKSYKREDYWGKVRYKDIFNYRR